MGPLARIVSVVMAGVAVGCTPDPEPPEIVWEGEFLRYRTEEPVNSICAGTFQRMDERTGYIIDQFESSDDIVDYSWVAPGALAEYCSSDLGCAHGKSAFSRLTVHDHELFHAARGAAAYRGLEEGLAVFFGDDLRLPGEVEGDVGDMLRDSSSSEGSPLDYPRLGHFASYLLAEYGEEQFVALDHASKLKHNYSQLSSNIESAFGEPMDAVLADFDARYPICELTEFLDDGFECSREGIQGPAEDAEEIELYIPIGCDDPETQGPRGGKIWKTVTLHIPAEGRHQLSLYRTNADSAQIVISECGSSCFDIETAYRSRSAGLLNVLPCFRQGSYTMHLEVDEGDRGEFYFKLTRFGHKVCD